MPFDEIFYLSSIGIAHCRFNLMLFIFAAPAYLLDRNADVLIKKYRIRHVETIKAIFHFFFVAIRAAAI